MVDRASREKDLLHNVSPQQLIQLKKRAVEAKNLSYSPYSKFRVGCCILTKDNQFVDGANVENVSYGGAICAERTAAVKAVTNGQREWIAIAVSGDRLDDCTSPCGICRQFLREFATLDIPVIMLNSDGSDFVLTSFGDLLPMSFGPGSF